MFLKIQRHQGFQPVGVGGWDLGQRLLNRGPKRREIRMLFPINARSLRAPRRSITFKFGEFDGKNDSRIPHSAASPCTIALR